MSKKELICAIITVIIVAVGFITYMRTNDKEEKAYESEQNYIEISEILDEPVTDECTKEWEEYVKNRIEEVSSSVSDDNTHYLLKDVLGYIEVYYLGENKEEFLYKKTNIPTTYLSKQDIEELKKGIEVVGITELNSRLEDFE